MEYDIIPSIDECYEIMKGRMPRHIIEHSEQVMRVALCIIDNLKPGIILNKNLVIAASLLHDITKNKSLTTKEHHDVTGGIYIRNLGYNKVADIIEEHVELKKYELNNDLEEKEIVYYADKRVMHNKIVTVEERISDLIIRYGKTEAISQHILKSKVSIINIGNKINYYSKKDINEIISGQKNEINES